MFDRLRQGLSGIVNRISKSSLTEESLDPILWDLQLQLISNDVAVDVAERIVGELKERLVGTQASRFGDKTPLVMEALACSIESVLDMDEGVDLVENVDESRRRGEPYVVLFVGINGTGKTTTIAKIAKLLTDSGYSVVLASGDTYRAGAIEQLEEHARRLGVKVIKHQYGGDSAAVAYDAVEHARARGINAVLIDTAGRMQTNRNLMEELRKMKRVVQPDITVMILDSLIGNDATEQAVTFHESVGFDVAVLTKVDADAKGGACLSVSYITGEPVIYLGVGQGYDDLERFDPKQFAERLIGDA